VTVTAVPDAGAAFTGFSGALAGTANPQPLLMDGDKSVTASFARAPSCGLGPELALVLPWLRFLRRRQGTGNSPPA
jgi:hypothetical protein